MGIKIETLENSYKITLCTTACQQRFILGIHSSHAESAESGSSAGLDAGHAWISVHAKDEGTGEITDSKTFGMWPDNNPRVMNVSDFPQSQDRKFTDIRIGVEENIGYSIEIERFGLIPDNKINYLEGRLSADLDYNLGARNCSTFARQTWNSIFTSNRLKRWLPTGRFFGVITPRKLGSIIENREKNDPTSLEFPLTVN